MKAIAKVTSFMEGFEDDIWIKKGDVYDLELNDEMDDEELYEFIDAKGHEHYIGVKDFDKYFKEVQNV